MSEQFVLIERDQGVATVTIQRPEKLNALNQAVIAELTRAFEALADDESLRAVILTGAGDKAFVAGADIAEIRAQDPAGAHRLARAGQALMNRIETLPVPVIAAINGYALGGGLELALACHLRYAATSAKLGLPEIKLGLLPGFGGTQRLSRLIGRASALEMMLNGDPVTAGRAAELGLVQQVLEPPTLLDHCREVAGRLAGAAPLAVRAILDTVHRGLDQPLDHALALEAGRFALLCASDDAREGTGAFLEKRKPAFSGR